LAENAAEVRAGNPLTLRVAFPLWPLRVNVSEPDPDRATIMTGCAGVRVKSLTRMAVLVGGT